jgi:ABC-type glycerol-3-phosphate transport system substrate-binding protein
MLRRLGVTAAAVLLAGCATAPVAPDQDDAVGPVTLRFLSLASQESGVAATERIVAAWNAAHPDVQVRLAEGAWDSVHDQLATRFADGTAPDVIHDESADITGFARQGHLADLGPHLSEETRASVPQAVWDAVTVDGTVVAAPTLLQSYVVFANTTVLEQAGVPIPTSPTWTWDELADAARRTTTPDRPGLGWGLRQPAATVTSLGLGFGGTFLTGSGPAATVRVGDAELEVPRRIHDMAYADRSLDPASLTQSGSDVITAFLAGRYAMVVAANHGAQQLAESAPSGFAWRVLPALAGTSPNQATNPQTLSVPAAGPHIEQAADFIEFVMRAENLASLAQGEWLVPASEPARDAVHTATGGRDGWEATLAGARYLRPAPFRSVIGYPQWEDRIATPALQRYLAGQSDLPTLQRELTDGWTQVSGG